MHFSTYIQSTAITQGLEVIGDRWTVLIIRDAFLGRTTFGEFRDHTGAPRSTLVNRLDKLVFNGILYKNPYNYTPLRFEYRLTDKGRALYPWALLIWDWDRKWADTAEDQLPQRIYHKGCDSWMRPVAACAHCKEPLALRDIGHSVNHDYTAPTANTRSKRLTRARSNRGGAPADKSLWHVTDVIADRWTPQILAACFFGIGRYDDFRRKLGIATNILSDRLKQLVETGILVRNSYQESPPRYRYELTEKGEALYPITLALQQWVLEWIPQANTLPIHLKHTPCGKTLTTAVVCNVCSEPLKAHEVRFVFRDDKSRDNIK
ncbi:winged helix-turn-helix transcriptional regulator [Parahaliea mediterranea]|uniref:winged helix-turn-helix transcriptional regulator n=1 Tax=Parahaliea mediterranea TaxID=651086 RepID=UPI000E2E5E39|nr:helix-turn-helix domain-containing protein [Parahaliea mediterranea]